MRFAIFGILMAALVIMGAAVKIPGTVRLKYDDVDIASGVETFANLKLLDGDRGLVWFEGDVTIYPAPSEVHLDHFINGPGFNLHNVEIDENGWHGDVIIVDGTHVWEPEEGAQPWFMKMLLTPAEDEDVYTMTYTLNITVLEDDDGFPIHDYPMTLTYDVLVNMPPQSGPG